MNDLKFAIRQLLKNPGFTAVAVLTLALGIGATASVFSLVHGVLLTPPPYPKPEQIAFIVPAKTDGQAYPLACVTAQWIEWQKATNSFEAIAGYEWGFQFVVLPDGSESIQGLFVTPDYFKVIGVEPLLGREFLPADMATRGGDETTIILGYDLWQRRFNGDPNVLGQVVRLSRRRPMTVVGVMPPGVRFLPSRDQTTEPNYEVNAQVDFWIPLWPPDLTKPKQDHCNMVGRLRDGASLTQAQAELASIAARQGQADRDFEGITAQTQPLQAEWNREGRRLLMPMAGAVALVFFIACGNAAGLLLARGLQRQHQYAVRAALGARPLQLCRPVVMESLLLALLGGLVGTGLAVGCVDGLKLIAGAAIPRLDAVRLGWPMLTFCLGAAAVAGTLAALLPAWRSIKLDPASELKAGSRTASVGRPERRLLGSIAAVQIALTLALLVGAGLLIQTVHSLTKIRPGYDTQNILTMSVTAVGTNQIDFHTRAIERVAQLPGVKSAAFGWGLPLTGNKWNTIFDIDGQLDTGALKDKLNVPTRSVTPDYFAALGLTIAEGRGFRASDTRGVPMVAIINQVLADRYFSGGNPIGRKLRFLGQTNSIEIIGIMANARTDALTDTAEPELYFSFWQSSAFSKHLVLRTHADPRGLAAIVQKELRAIDPTVSIENVKTLEEIRADSVASRTFAMNLLVGFAMVACLLATVGIYGVLSLAVGSRQTEIAIRMALGAQREDVLRLILGGGLRLAAVGVALGLIIALALAVGLKTYLFGVAPTDPLTLAAMVVVVMAITLATCWIPARRATRVGPLAALRNE